MKNQKLVLHPSNPIIYIMLFISLATIGLGILSGYYTLVQILSDKPLDLSLPLAFALCLGGGFYLFVFFLKMRLVITNDDLLIVIPLDKTLPHTQEPTHFLQQVETIRITLKDLRFFGSYFASDVIQYLRFEEGQLADALKVFEKNGQRFTAKLNSKVFGVRQVFVFYDDHNGFTVIDGELYGLRQTQRLLYELTHRTGLIESGHVEAKHTWNNVWADAFIALMVLVWILVVPFLISYIPLWINPMANMDDLGTIAWILLFLGNLSSLGILEGLKFNKVQRSYKSYKLGMISFISVTLLGYIGAAIVLYFAIR